MNLKFKWTISRAKDTYGYNICTLLVNGVKASRCNGGGYDMKGTALGEWVASDFRDELLKLEEEFCGLTFHDPKFDPGKYLIDGETVDEREESGKSLGLERYQAFHSASSPVPTEKHVIPQIDGGTGFSSVEKILKAIGYEVECVNYEDEVYTVRAVA